MSKQIQTIRSFLAKHGFPVYTQTALNKAQRQWQDLIPKNGRRVPQIDYYTETGLEHIIEPGYDYRSLIQLSIGNEVVRTVHEAIVKEAVRNRWQSQARFACKCQVCGAEYEKPKTECDTPECNNTTDWIYPDQTQKLTLDAFIEDPNSDDEMKDIIESLLRYMLAPGDHWLSVQAPNLEKLTPLTVYVEDSVYMRVVSDEYGRIGNGQYFCPICTRKAPSESWAKGERCPRHPDIELKETAYVYAEGNAVKARFAKDECFHGKISPWLPGFYDNCKLISALRIVLSITASDKKNLDEYSTGRVKQILAASGLTPDQANEMIGKALEQPKFKLEVNPLTGEKVVKDTQMVLGLGAQGNKLESIPGMPDSEKMQSLEWWKLWKIAIHSLYGVADAFTGESAQGTTGQNPRMKLDVSNNTTELYQKAVEDCFNNFVLPKLGITDWLFKFNAVEEKDEMQDITVLNGKLDAMAKAVNLGLDCELTDEGEVKVSGTPLTLEQKNKMRMEQVAQMQGQNPKEAGSDKGAFKDEKPFSAEKAKEVS